MRHYFILVIFLLTQFAISGCESNDDLENEVPQLLLADPHILLYDSVYYAYGTSNANGIEVYYSKNLFEWTKHNRLALDKADVFGEYFFWAPEVYYIKEHDTFLMCYSGEQKICLAQAKSPLGPFIQIDKKPLFESDAIDNTLFMDEEGWYMFFTFMKPSGEEIWSVEIDSVNLKPILSTLHHCISPSLPWETQEGLINEGASVIKYQNIYYLLYSGNSYTSTNYSVGYATSHSINGPWEKAESNVILSNPEIFGNRLIGAGHGSPFKDIDGNWRYIFHAHNSDSKVNPRKAYICDLTFTHCKTPTPELGDNIILPVIISN